MACSQAVTIASGLPESEAAGWTIPPWILSSHKLVSWWDMQNFRAINLFLIDSMIERLKSGHDILAVRPQGRSPIDRENASTLLVAMAQTIEDAGLSVSLKKIQATHKALGETPPISDEDLAAAFDDIFSRIEDEAEDRLFMFIPPERAKLYDQPEAFGKEVNAKFPAIQYDLVEAGNCFAAGRSTAVVFHLMRIMETGVQQFGTKLGVALATEKNWQNILDEINKAIKALPKSPITVEMSEAAANLYAVKLAWRNEVMHPKDTYTLEEADNLIRQVRIFMQQLAKIV